MSWWYRIARHSAWVLTRQSYTKPKRKRRLGSDTGRSRRELRWSGEGAARGFPDAIFTEEEGVQRAAQGEGRRRHRRESGARLLDGFGVLAVLGFFALAIVGYVQA